MNLLAEFREGMGISWAAIRANKMRSALTTLGIVIGIVTVTLMGTAITGMNSAFLSSLSFIGTDVLYVERFNWFSHSHADWERMQKRREVTLGQARALEGQLTLARAIAPVAQTSRKITRGRRFSDSVTILGSTRGFLRTSSVTLSRGRLISDPEFDGGRPVAMIGWEVARRLFEREDPVGKRIQIGTASFEVVGVLEKQGSFLGAVSLDNQAIVTLGQFVSEFVSSPDYQIQVKVLDLGDLDEARAELRNVMRRVRRLAPTDPDDFAINQQDQFVKMFYQVAGTIGGVGLFVTGLSLFVGGIGIMNIMFVSVAERTREIGIRKAIGAKRRTILMQFLIEAATICLLGGCVGLAIAWPITLVIRNFLPATLSMPIVGLALLVSIVTGVASGFFPAWRAARMNPVDALRSGE